MQTDYDIAIIGGGLAGLATAIQLSRHGYAVVVFEKDSYPSHKVCGEYVSLESWDFLSSLGLPLNDLQLPVIKTLRLTAPNGRMLTTELPLGGFGISRYLLDSSLAQIATANGVTILQNTRVDDATREDGYTIHFAGQKIRAKFCCGAYGKRSNLDVRWNRPFVHDENARINNYVGIKYHVKTGWPADVIGLHNFYNGYCGISKIEDDKYCLCYMTKAENLKNAGNSIERMQQEILYQNPHLKTIFSNVEVVQNFPLAISQISFASKSKTENGMLMLGDAASMITPLCGNGMSIAMHTSKIAASLLHQCLQQKITTAEMTSQYQGQWRHAFAGRLKTGRILQSFFGSNSLSNALVRCFNLFPFLTKPLIKLTHGKPF